MASSRSLTRLAVAAAITASVLAACGSNQAPSPSSTTPTTTTTTPASTSSVAPTEKSISPTGGNLFTPQVIAPSAGTYAPDVPRNQREKG